MKKIVYILLAVCMSVLFVSCGAELQQSDDTAEDTCKIGVLVYNIADREVVSFRKYLEDYIAGCFDGVEFLYSESIEDEEEELTFIQDAIDAGVQGIMSFQSFDLAEEVSLCAENGVYYMMASGSVADDAFAAVQDDPYFLGVVGPGDDVEYQAGADLATHMYENKTSDTYFILSGGGSLGNEMHLQRTEGVLDTLQSCYGVELSVTSEELALSAEPVTISEDGLTLCICPGYMNFEEFLGSAEEAFAEGTYDQVIAVMAADDIMSTFQKANARVAMVDCYSDENMLLFNEGVLCYLTGKYSSIIGPSFTAMYNACLGYADDFRDQGKAFQISQGFWSSDSKDDFAEKYAYSSSLELNAYNYEDLANLCKNYNESADFEDLTDMAEAYDFPSAVARRQS